MLLIGDWLEWVHTLPDSFQLRFITAEQFRHRAEYRIVVVCETRNLFNFQVEVCTVEYVSYNDWLDFFDGWCGSRLDFFEDFLTETVFENLTNCFWVRFIFDNNDVRPVGQFTGTFRRQISVSFVTGLTRFEQCAVSAAHRAIVVSTTDGGCTVFNVPLVGNRVFEAVVVDFYKRNQFAVFTLCRQETNGRCTVTGFVRSQYPFSWVFFELLSTGQGCKLSGQISGRLFVTCKHLLFSRFNH
ncbi:hypothetical protein D3C72_1111960 [compost metagenome]